MDFTEDYIDLPQYWKIIQRRWLTIAFISFSVIGITSFFTYSQKPVYETEGQLLLSNSNSLSATDATSSKALSSVSGQGNPVITEIQIIKSNPIIKETIKELDLKPKFSLIKPVIKFITQKESSTQMSPNELMQDLTIANIKDTDIISISYQSTSPKQAVVVVNKIMDLYIARNIKSQREQAAATRRFIEEQLPKANREMNHYAKALREFKERSKIASLSSEEKIAITSVGDLQKLMTSTKAQLADIQIKSKALRNQTGLTPQVGMKVNALSQSPAVQKALTDLQDVQRKLATTRTLFQAGHPQLQDLVEKESALKSYLISQVEQVVKPSILTAPSLNSLQAGQTQQKLTAALIDTEVQRIRLQHQIEVLHKTELAYRQRMTVFPKLEQMQSEIERQLKVAQSTYEGLLKSLQIFKIQENQTTSNVEIIQRPKVPNQPTSPNFLLNFALGTFLGIVLSIGVALVIEYLDNSIKTVLDVQEYFDLPVLGKIPSIEVSVNNDNEVNNKTIRHLPIRDNPNSAVSEAYRTFLANIKFLDSDIRPRVITITSSVPQEGKSTTTANLALTLSEMGNKVLIVDADLRRPSQHQIWELPNSVGLTNMLVESDELTHVACIENEYIHIITSGVISPKPGRLIDSQKMINLIQEWRGLYDYVLIDTPPLAVATEALLLSRMTDGTIMVARPGILDRGSASASMASLEKLIKREDKTISQIKLLGLLINDVKPENDSDFYYYTNNYYFENVKPQIAK